jgi:hypothetical protein
MGLDFWDGGGLWGDGGFGSAFAVTAWDARGLDTAGLEAGGGAGFSLDSAG